MKAFSNHRHCRIALVPRRPRGFAFLEVLVSIVLFSLTIVMFMTIQANALIVINEMQYRLEAMALVDGYLAKMWGANTGTHDLYKEGGEEFEKFTQRILGDEFSDAPALPGAAPPSIEITPMSDGGNHVRITLSWQPPGAETPRSIHRESFITR
jgi:hypothetical protein